MKYNSEQVARIRAESERLLRDPPARPEPKPPREVHIPETDPVAEWREWHDARDRERAAAKAELRRSEHEMRTQERAMIDTLIVQVAALRRDHDAQAEACNEQARALIEFADSVATRMHALAALADRFERTLEDLKTARDRESSALRAQLDLVSRQNEFLDQQLTAARREIDQTTARRARDRANIDAKNIADNVRRLDLTLSSR